MHFGGADCEKREFGQTAMAGFGTVGVELISEKSQCCGMTK
jgi:hypothetical protein